ncbi:MAG: hypothetical protein RB191_07930 [Terriglobia bacterium]|nr:hypothetical protein [Terriglobia bacterium]
MDTRNAGNDQKTVTGIIDRVTVSGEGANSAEIVVAINVDGVEQAYAVYAYPSTESSVFSSFVTILTAAFLSKTKIDLSYVKGPRPTPQIVQLVCPSVTH